MKRIKIVLFAVLFMGLNFMSNAQKLMEASYTFSKEKPVYMTLADGTEVSGVLEHVDMEKGILKSVTLKHKTDSPSMYRPAEINKLYIASKSTDQLGKKYSFMEDPSRWDNASYDQELFKNGYVCFEQAEIQLGRKSRVLLMQLLNPSYSSKIKVYQDPWTSELTSTKTVSSRYEANRSYFVKDGSRPAFKLDASGYKDNFVALFGECQQMLPLKEKANWTQFDQHVYDYTNCK